MFVRCQRLMEGPGPSDIIVSLQSADGQSEEVVVDKGSLEGDFLAVAMIGRDKEGRVLIELPREAASGQGRIWVTGSELRELMAAE